MYHVHVTWYLLPSVIPFDLVCTVKSYVIYIIIVTLHTNSSSSNPFTSCGALGIHEELPDIAISSCPFDLFPWSSCASYFPSVVLRHVRFGVPLLLYPWGFQSNAVFAMAPASLLNVCPIQFHFLLFIWISVGFCLAILHNSSFVILSVHFMFIMCLTALCYKSEGRWFDSRWCHWNFSLT